MQYNIHVYKISEKLYRVRNIEKGTVKDVWIAFGKIKKPENIFNALTPTEEMAVEMELF